MLAAGLVSQLVADLLRLPRMLVLLGAGALLGPHGLDAIDVPLDSMGAQLLLTLGVSFILFHGGLGLSTHVLEQRGRRARDARRPGRRPDRVSPESSPLRSTCRSIEAPDRRRARADRPGDPDPAVRASAAARQGLADDHRRVRAERLRPAPCSPSPSPGRPQRRAPRSPTPLTEFVVDLAISTALGIVFGVVLGRRLEPARGHLARVAGDRRDGGRRGRLLLDRLGGRQRLPRRVPRRADRREHGPLLGLRHALPPRASRCARSSRRLGRRW